MPGCPPNTFNGVTETVWNCLKTRAQAVGVTITGDSGTASAQGVTVEYRRDAQANTLTVTITQLPAWGNCAMATARLREVAGTCGVL